MNNCDKFTLNWTGYDTNFKECFRKLREDKRMFDVTLATDDAHHIQAHRIILSAGSNFFSDIFMQNNQSSMLVYLKGIASDNLESVIDFIYNGEVFISQEQLEVFVETGKELKVKGLESVMPGVGENTTENLINPQEIKHEYENNDTVADEKEFTSSTREIVVEINQENLELKTNEDISLQINAMTEKIEGVWKCKTCGKTTSIKRHMHDHAERHIKGMSHSCHICTKTFPNRPNLKTHIFNIHSELISCDVCGKTGMNRKAYRSHKQRNHSQNIVC